MLCCHKSNKLSVWSLLLAGNEWWSVSEAGRAPVPVQCLQLSDPLLRAGLVSWSWGRWCTRDHQQSQLSSSHQHVPLSLSPRPSPSCPWCQWCHPSPGLYVSVISLQSPSCHPWHIHDITPPLWRQQSDVAPGWRCCLEASLPELGSLARCDDGAGGVDWRGAQS